MAFYKEFGESSDENESHYWAMGGTLIGNICSILPFRYSVNSDLPSL